MDLSPDFQRGHVWTEAQQEAFMAHVLEGGSPGVIRWNTIGNPTLGVQCILDGLQRLTACRAWLAGKIVARFHDGQTCHVSEVESRARLNAYMIPMS